jgi:hypothetical protein
VNWTYHVLGVRLRLPFALPISPAADDGWDYEVEVRRCTRLETSVGRRSPPRQLHTDEQGWTLTLVNHRFGVCEFRCLERERRIVVTTSERNEDLPAPILSIGLATILHHRGVTIWHGTTVARAGRAMVILGESGRGKSTLATALSADGWALLSEDMTVCDEQLRVLPGPDVLRALPTTRALVGESVGGFVPVLSAEFSDGKVWVPASRLPGGACRVAVPLATVVLLGPRRKGPTVVRRLSQPEALVAMLNQRWGGDWLPVDRRRDLNVAQAMAASVPVCEWQLEDDLAVLPLLANKLTEAFSDVDA